MSKELLVIITFVMAGIIGVLTAFLEFYYKACKDIKKFVKKI